MMQDPINDIYTGEEPDSMIEFGIASPLMLSPTNESSNPFFISTGSTADSIDCLIKDATSMEMTNTHLFTPLDLPWFSHLKETSNSEGQPKNNQEEDQEDGYFTLTNSQSWKRQRRSQSPTHFSVTSSHTSCASSPPPSESGSEVFDNTQVDTQVDLLTLPMASFALPSVHGDGFMEASSDIKDQYDLMMMPASEMTIRSHRKNANSDRSLQSIMSLNTFNLSDFISDHEHDQLATQLPQPQSQVAIQQSSMYSMTASPAMITAGLERPLHHRNVRSMTSFNDARFSPLSSFSSTPELDCRMNLMRDQNLTNIQHQVIDSHTLYGGRPAQDYFTNRPKMPMRIHSNPLESLSCNPSQITPFQEVPPMEPMSEDGSCFYSSSSSNEHSDGFDVKYQGDDEISPPAPYTYGTDGAFSNLWSLAKSDAFPRDIYESPKLGQLHRMMKLDHPSSSELYNDQKNSDGIFGLGLQGMTKRGGIRNARMTSLSTSRHSASPYQSPLLLDQTPLDSDVNGTRMTIGGQVITGIITKRSRGRRVPSNPEELNNLGKSGKIYTCKVPGCGKCFKRSEHLKRHVRSIHTNEKPFTCHCGKTFSRHDNLNQHARVHGNDGTSTSQQDSVSPPSSPMPSAFELLEGESRRNQNSRLRKTSDIHDYYEHGDASLDSDL